MVCIPYGCIKAVQISSLDQTGLLEPNQLDLCFSEWLPSIVLIGAFDSVLSIEDS